MPSRSPETEADLRIVEKWTEDILHVLLPRLKHARATGIEWLEWGPPPAVKETPGQIARTIVSEATYQLKLALRFSSDWPEYRHVAEQLQQAIDEARELFD
jgi:hypothetical protein